jgi:hypothetical protein
MPKDITHWVLAEKAFQRLDDGSTIKKIIASRKNLYMIGAVVPDIPLYVIYGRHGRLLRELAEAVHDRRPDSYAAFDGLHALFGRRLSESALALMLGVISHIHADAAIHPLVYFFSGIGSGIKKDDDRACVRHHTLEAYLDLYMQQKTAIAHRLFLCYLKRIEIDRSSFQLMAAALFSLHGQRAVRIINKAVWMNAFFQSLFEKDLPRRFLDFLNRLPGVDLTLYSAYFYPDPRPNSTLLFTKPFRYRHPATGEEMLFSVDQLIDTAVQRTVEVFYALESGLQKRKDPAEILSGLKGPNLYSGRTDCGKADFHVFDTSTDISTLVLADTGGGTSQGIRAD